jgi:hypothetical protein
LSAQNFFGDPIHGLVSVSWEDATLAGATVADGSILFLLNFHLIGAQGSSTPIAITNSPTPLEVTDAGGNVLTAALTAGQIQINGNVNLSGNIIYYRSNAPVPNVTLKVTGGATTSTLSAADGSFAVPVPSCIDLVLTPELLTDMPNLTAEVTSLDVLAVRNHVQGRSLLTSPFALLAADVNGSHTITAADIRQIRMFINQSRTNFTAQGGSLWRFVPSDYVFPDPAAPWSAPMSRSLTGVTINTGGLDFRAIKLGDVNGSRDPAPLMAPRHLNLMSAIPNPVRLSATRQLVNPDEMVQIAIESSKVERLTTAQFTVAWDPEVIKFVAADGSSLSGFDSENLGHSRVSRGQLFVSWEDPNLTGVSVSSGQTLLTLNFRVIGRPGSASRVTVFNGPTPIELSIDGRVVKTQTTPGIVAVRASQPGTLEILAHSSSQLDLWYDAPAGSVWSLESSADLKIWTAQGNPSLAPGDSLVTVSVPPSTERRLFYRAVRIE